MSNSDIVASVVKKAIEDKEKKRIEDMVKQAQLNKEPEPDVSPEVTAGKEFVRETVPEPLMGKVLSEATELKEGDVRNPTARMVGYTAAQLPAFIPIGGSKLSKDVIKGVLEKVSQKGESAVSGILKKEAEPIVSEIKAPKYIDEAANEIYQNQKNKIYLERLKKPESDELIQKVKQDAIKKGIDVPPITKDLSLIHISEPTRPY